MKIWSLGFLLFFLNSFNALAQNSFYETDSIRVVKINFYQNNWDQILDSLYIEGDRNRILANILIDGVSYDSVGVRYKGYSSASINRLKNPFNIKLNYIKKGQNHHGIDKIKLSNVFQDPSFIREVLSYQIIRQYMPASEANFANLYINDTLIGLYTNVEAVNNEFLEKHFTSKKNVLVKGNPKEVDLYGENSNLSNTPGTDTLNYASLYVMESDYGWAELYGLIDTLNNFKHALNEVLNIDRTLWMHALNYTLVNFDSYIGYAQNYYLYQDNFGRFNPIIWDLNMSFGSFRLADASTYYDGFSIAEAKVMDPLSHYYGNSVYARPLLRNIFESSRYRKMYLAHIRTIVEENFTNNYYKERAEEMYSHIDASVLADTNKFYSYSDFQNNLYTTVNDLIDYPGIVDLMEARSAYLATYKGYQNAPVIDSLIHYPVEPISGDTIVISCKVSDASEVILAHRHESKSIFQKQLMNDSGLYGDLVSSDGWFTTQVVSLGTNLEYYLYAENDSAGIFSPKRADYEYHSINTKISNGDLVINELMADNTSTVKDENSEFDDWIELYNTTSNSINLSGLFLSDDVSNLTKWALPNVSIQAESYQIIWADADTDQSEIHSNFKLSASGEQLFISDADAYLIDSLTFPIQIEDIAYGRLPNGTGAFTYISPTVNTSNNTASVIPAHSNLVLKAHPNPVSEVLYISIESQIESALNIYDALGRKLYSKSFSAGIIEMDISTLNLKPGVYFVVVKAGELVSNQRIIKL